MWLYVLFRLSGIEVTLVRVRAKQRGLPATVWHAPDLTREQQAYVDQFRLGRWIPALLSSSVESTPQADRKPAA
jgi:hypothetical protein